MKPCSKCGDKEVRYRIQMREVTIERTDPRIPKYTIHVREDCAECGAYRRFAPQTPELVGKLDKQVRRCVLKG